MPNPTLTPATLDALDAAEREATPGEWRQVSSFIARYCFGDRIAGAVVMREPGCYRATVGSDKAQTFEDQAPAIVWVEANAERPPVSVAVGHFRALVDHAIAVRDLGAAEIAWDEAEAAIREAIACRPAGSSDELVMCALRARDRANDRVALAHAKVQAMARTLNGRHTKEVSDGEKEEKGSV